MFIYGLLIGLLIGLISMILLHEIRRKCITGTDKQNLENTIQVLARQAARWSTAAKQDENAMISILHANYGAGYLWALKDIATPKQIKAVTGIDFMTFESDIVSIQDNSTKNMIKVCPKFAPPPSYLTKIAGEG